MIVESDVEKSGKSFNQVNRGSDNRQTAWRIEQISLRIGAKYPRKNGKKGRHAGLPLHTLANPAKFFYIYP